MVDIHQFRRLVGQAATRRGVAERLASWRDAVGAWHGEPLVALVGAWVERTRDAWYSEYRDAALGWAYAEIESGNPTVVIEPLTELINRYPLVEGVPAMLMRALHAADRRVDAMDCYAAARQRLADELAEDPGPELRAVYSAILRREPLPPAPGGALAAEAPVPAQLPAAVHGFAGRAEHLAQLDTIADAIGNGDGEPTAVVISAITGTAGIGKTALAVHWAHRHRSWFPDGQMYVNLRGFDPGSAMMNPATALRLFFDALGVAPQRIPADLDAQVNLYRTLLAGKRVLVVLDNASDADQVRPLLPGAPGCLTLITSRNQLTTLVAIEGAYHLALDLLTTDEAHGLLTHRLGAARVSAEPNVVSEIITACARLPLALTIVAARAAIARDQPLAVLARELRTSRDRLDALSTGDNPQTDLRAVFSWSYQALTPDAARLFRLLGLHPGPDTTGPATASLAALPLPQARALLAELTRANLLVEHTVGRYTFHDLLRAYATSLAHTTDSDDQRHSATCRILDHYLHTANAAAQLVHPAGDLITLGPPQPGTFPETPADRQQALIWFTAEHAVLLAALNHAATAGFATHTWRLAWTLNPFFIRRGHWQDDLAAQHAAVAAASRLADPLDHARARRTLAGVLVRLGHYDDAHAQLRHALALTIQVGDQVGQAHTHIGLSVMLERQDRDADALEHDRNALDLYRAANHQYGLARALNSAGWHHARLSNYQQALTYCQQALTLSRELDDRNGQSAAWDSLGYAHHHQGNHAQAITCYRHALDLTRDSGNRYYEAETLTHLGDTHHAINDLDAAREAWQQALTILDQLDHPNATHLRAKLANPQVRRQ